MKLSNSEKNRLKEKYGEWAIITGASSGIGLELAERLAESGFNLLINSRGSKKLEEIANNLRTKFSIEVKIVATDVSEKKAWMPSLRLPKDCQ